MRICLKQAHLLDAKGDHGQSDLYLKEGVIEGRDLGGDVDQSFDAAGLSVTPAFLDLHTHFRDPGEEVKEDLRSGLSAAAAGGFGTVVTMPRTSPVIDEPALVETMLSRAERLQLARLRPAAALSHGLEGKRMSDFAALQEAGAVMLTNDGVSLEDSHLMRRACEYAGELGLLIQTHCEDELLCQDGAMHEGIISHHLGLPGRPASAEAIMVYRDCELAHMTGARVHIAHVSTKRSVQIIEWFKEQGAPVTAEVTPYHLLLTDESLTSYDPLYKVSPPLRPAEDVDALRDALRRGVIDCVVTDHAPYTREEKERDLLSAPAGMATLEVAFPLLYTHLVKEGLLELPTLLERMQQGPAAVMGWKPPTLDAGQPADVVLLDLSNTHPVDPSTFKSKARFSPWTGQELSGWPKATFIRGKQVF